MKRLRWSQRAADDLQEIGAYIGGDSRVAARRWLERLRERAVRASFAPRAGRVVPELGRDDVREVFLKSYRLLYQVLPDGIAMLTVFEGHRSFPKDLIDSDGEDE